MNAVRLHLSGVSAFSRACITREMLKGLVNEAMFICCIQQARSLYHLMPIDYLSGFNSLIQQ